MTWGFNKEAVEAVKAANAPLDCYSTHSNQKMKLKTRSAQQDPL